MAGALVATLAAPLREMQGLVGPGGADDMAAALHAVRTALFEVSAATGQAWRRTAEEWTGAGADAAAAAVAATVAGTEDAAERVAVLARSADDAGAAVARARRRLAEIVDGFEARARALEPYLDYPDVVEALVNDARRALAEATAVVDELRAELDGHAAAVTAPAPAPSPAATTPSGYPPSPLGAAPGGLPAAPASGGAGGLGSLVRDIAEAARFETPDAATFGDGVAVRLPDGAVVTAPNAVAANAVRYALTQLGVPYHWGGTTPGVGLDCSGLTQWAYREAGLTLPRLAQEQDVGAPVAFGDLRPGDLAVWDGHVAMIVGNGQMIEAGDPVKLSPIRTTNAGQGFQGFWRPTA
ncbi:C40 family peptidase [Mycolicibacterium phlei]